MKIKAILTDIEGTTSSIAFVKEVLFPYAAEKLPAWLEDNQNDPKVREQITLVGETIGEPASNLEAITQQLLTWIDEDIKATPLKALQGMLWKFGYESGDYRAHVYEDAVQKLQDWHADGIPLYVYSSGSVQAQKLFFQHTRYGDLGPLFSGYFDTTTGAKTDSDSYTAIAAEMHLAPSDIVFLSDIEAEVDAAREAGMNSILISRPEDSTKDPDEKHYAVAKNFHEVSLIL